MSRITEMLAGATSRNEAAANLANASKADLAEAARVLDMRTDGNKAQITERLVNGTVGTREDRAAILNARL